MRWIKIDDQLPDNVKIVSVGPTCAWLYVSGLCYCNRLMTNGFIPIDKVEQLLPHTQGRPIEEAPLRLAQILCDAGLWTSAILRGVEGFKVHHYLHYQASKKEILAARAQNALRQARHRNGNGAIRQ